MSAAKLCLEYLACTLVVCERCRVARELLVHQADAREHVGDLGVVWAQASLENLQALLVLLQCRGVQSTLGTGNQYFNSTASECTR